mgnify:CR=1 FL=1
MNTSRNQENVNKLIMTYLKSRGFIPTMKSGVVTIGFIKVSSMSEAIELNNHKQNN